MSRPEEPPAPQVLLAAPGHLVRRLHQAYAAAWARHVDALLTGPQFAVLTAVDAYPGADPGLLARAVALDAPTLGGIVRGLQDRGLLLREAPLADTDRRLVALTPAGYAVLRATATKVRALEERLLPGYDADRTRALLGELGSLAEHWERLQSV